MSDLADFFGSRLQFVDQTLIHIQKTYGYLEWMRGRSEIRDLPGYDVSLLDSRNFLILTRADAEWKMIYWMCENDIDGWAYQRVLEGFGAKFTYYFYFRHDGDRALARLTAA